VVVVVPRGVASIDDSSVVATAAAGEKDIPDTSAAADGIPTRKARREWTEEANPSASVDVVAADGRTNLFCGRHRSVVVTNDLVAVTVKHIVKILTRITVFICVVSFNECLVSWLSSVDYPFNNCFISRSVVPFGSMTHTHFLSERQP
jgi:type IV secretory pathway TrbD component